MDKFKKALFFGFRGAGTSFLINGIANYLKYDTLDDALNAEQLLSPISGTISLTTDDYEVLQIPYGKNQNDDDGLPQYVFKDGDVNVVLIDGGALNKSGIEKFIANGVNMIVLSIPSTTTKINNVFTEILDQIISLFGEKVLSNMFFAFTYTNGSNYSPGEAATVVQNYFYKKVDKYSFSKENCFTFDNECFTQLAAARQNVHHTNTSRSWGPSKLSARRLVDELKKAKKNFKPIPIKRKKEEVQNEVPAKKHRPGTKKLEQLSGVLNTFQTKYARYLPSIPSREPVCELLHRFAELLKSADLDLESPLRVVKTMNASVLSVNIPSGVDSKLLSWHVKKARKALWNRVFIFDVPGFGVFENIFSSVSMEMDLIKILSSDAITPVKLLFCASCMYFATVPNAIEKYSKRIKLVTIAAEVMLATGSFHLIEELRDSYEYFLGPLSFQRSSCQFFSENCRWGIKPSFSLQKVEKKCAELKISFEAAKRLYIYGNHDDVDHFIGVLESFADHVREDKVTFPKAIHRHGQKHILSSNPSTSKSTEKIEMSESELEEVLTAASTSNSKDVSKVATAASTSNSKDVSKVPTAGHVSQLANLELEEVSVPKEYYTVDLPEDYDTVCQIQLRTTTPNKQDAEIFGPCKLPYRSIKKLQKNTEIDDLIIDSYLELLADRFKALFVPVRHYKRLAESRGFDIVVKHLEADEVTDFDYLVFPCNSKCHWSGVFLNFKTKRSYLFDSGVETLSEASYANVFHCIEYVNTKLEWNFDWKEWLEIGDVGAEQKDGTSCGIYFLFNVRRAMEGTFPIHITQEQIHVFRKLILYELLSGKLYEKQMKIDQKDVVEHMHKPEQKILVDEPKDFEDVCDGLYETSAWNSKTGTSKFGKTKMAAADMKSLLPAGWITDAVIDKTAELQFEHFGRNAEIQITYIPVAVANLIFNEKSKNFAEVLKFIPPNFLSTDYFCVPLHVGSNHWALYVADLKAKYLYVYSSRAGYDFEAYIETLGALMEAIAKASNTDDFFQNFKILRCTGPQQKNDSDCGIYVLLWLHSLQYAFCPDISSTQIPAYRKRKFYDLMKGEFSGFGSLFKDPFKKVESPKEYITFQKRSHPSVRRDILDIFEQLKNKDRNNEEAFIQLAEKMPPAKKTDKKSVTSPDIVLKKSFKNVLHQ